MFAPFLFSHHGDLENCKHLLSLIVPYSDRDSSPDHGVIDFFGVGLVCCYCFLATTGKTLIVDFRHKSVATLFHGLEVAIGAFQAVRCQSRELREHVADVDNSPANCHLQRGLRLDDKTRQIFAVEIFGQIPWRRLGFLLTAGEIAAG